ncbi:fibroblast growth factor receptor homolog 1 isoform X1 [Labeo rohita]|uniref:fibroblast growth factor receptor homolog 1 isoform X1 n=2 Tax=Labeo rohita TaxID=84645 RepID=UPI0021E2D0B9|nr:fibroblast growth factor receptor homolog 1 isoform X1 [Labeo rohita]XP_050985401.1 fibroblast growth factor receptor homolog 1 isoform X1 [Labeo rohita]XP_050985402.1 fibroblast growth factor receptor homolog 1 isoform X1 [Labeo rohita]
MGTHLPNLDTSHIILICVYAVTIFFLGILGCLCLNKYRSMKKIIRELRTGRSVVIPQVSSQDSPPPSPNVLNIPELPERITESPLQRQQTKSSCRFPWKPPLQVPRFTKADVSLIQLIKAGREGVFYKARIIRGTCRGHSLVTCKISKEGITSKQMENEVSIMRKLAYHKNVMQLLDWNTSEEPYMLIMEFMSYGTLRSFVQKNKDELIADPELQSQLTIVSYHIALAMEHLRSKMVVHCDLALRNILVSRFPWEVKVAEFGLARDLTRMRSRRSSKKKQHKERVPLRWYPPEYFRNNYYSFKGDVWAFGIVLWEMQTFGTLPYPDLNTSEQVVYSICAGSKNTVPNTCRPEIEQVMQDCWLDPYTSRPTFTDIVKILENVVESDGDYVDVDNQRMMNIEEK